MKRLIVIIAIQTVCLCSSALATPAIEFSPKPDMAGNWYYDGAGTLSFDQVISVDKAMSSNSDALVGSLVYIPTFNVTGVPYGPYQLSPLGSPTISIFSTIGFLVNNAERRIFV